MAFLECPGMHDRCIEHERASVFVAFMPQRQDLLDRHRAMLLISEFKTVAQTSRHGGGAQSARSDRDLS
jgi:hypothetical protein